MVAGVGGNFEKYLYNDQVNTKVLLFYYLLEFLYPTYATSCGWYNVLDPSVRPSVSQSVLFFLSAQLL